MLLAQVSDTYLLADPSVSVWDQNPAKNLASVMSALPPVDALVVTGDVADDGTPEAYRLADTLTQRSAFRRFFIAGNHDDAAAMAAVFGDVTDTPADRPVRVLDIGIGQQPMDGARGRTRH